jgi:hypothetical protein
MKIEPKSQCPLNNFDPCRQLDCAWFMKIQGKNPQNGQDIDEWGCSMAWLPVLMIENSQQQRQTGAAVESFRNEMVKSNEVGQRVLLAAAGVPQQAQQMILENK